MMSYGIEGDTYTLDEDGNPHYTEKVTDNETLSPSDSVKKYSAQGFPCFYDIDREKQVSTEKEQAAMKTWTEGCDADWVLPVTSLTSEEGKEFGKSCKRFRRKSKIIFSIISREITHGIF
ncbi:MAG: hypothetical protein ACLRSW_03690 [Christensenellaceae bacterium]